MSDVSAQNDGNACACAEKSVECSPAMRHRAPMHSALFSAHAGDREVMNIDAWLQFHGQTILVLGGVVGLATLAWRKLVKLLRAILEQAVSSNQTVLELQQQDLTNNKEAKFHWEALHAKQAEIGQRLEVVEKHGTTLSNDLASRFGAVEQTITDFRPTLKDALGIQNQLGADMRDVKGQVSEVKDAVGGMNSRLRIVEERVERVERRGTRQQ